MPVIYLHSVFIIVRDCGCLRRGCIIVTFSRQVCFALFMIFSITMTNFVSFSFSFPFAMTGFSFHFAVSEFSSPFAVTSFCFPFSLSFCFPFSLSFCFPFSLSFSFSFSFSFVITDSTFFFTYTFVCT
eukprot:NODE_5_length_49639_cov_0.484336.p24 type:complete len:128 gc:universal NODE_5_length_49639_cov_0.484336:8552-8935(+)